jgi:hypothetical protein
VKIYVGLKEKTKPIIFESEKEHSKGTHPRFDVIYGPFTDKELDKCLKKLCHQDRMRLIIEFLTNLRVIE